MELGIRPATPAGARYVELCEEHAADFATRAAEHDREQTFPFENIAALKESGVLSAGLPEELGGFGIESTQDLVAGMNRLARGDGSTAIAANMHIGTPWYVTRLWQDAVGRRDTATAEQLYGTLGLLGSTIVMVAATEAGTSVGWPLTEATRAPQGWRLNGRKIFGTLSPAADILIVACRFKAAAQHDGWGWAYAFVPRDTEGLTLHDDWDALGMRASGSQSITFEDCFVPDAFFNPQERAWGGLDEGLLTIQVNANLALSAAMVGIAEQARDLVVEQVKTRRKAPSNRILAERTGIQYQVAEMEIDLATARAMIERTASIVDAYFLSHSASEVQLGELHELMCDFQATKWVANRKAIDVVDRALTLSGGAGYFTSSPLSRLYRDVRAGPFMQAYSPNEAREYIGRITLGLGADLDL
jgi:alkylation response protein AidB-like acyl-CoA dehydrogenase